MQYPKYEIDYIYCKSVSISNVADAVLIHGIKGFREKVNKFIKKNKIHVLEYVGKHRWGYDNYDDLVMLNRWLDDNHVKCRDEIKTDLTEDKLTFLIRSKTITKNKQGIYKWSGSVNYQKITEYILINHEYRKDFSDK